MNVVLMSLTPCASGWRAEVEVRGAWPAICIRDVHVGVVHGETRVSMPRTRWDRSTGQSGSTEAAVLFSGAETMKQFRRGVVQAVREALAQQAAAA